MSSQPSEPFAIRDWSLLAGVSLIWGSSFLLMGIAVDHFAPGVVAFLRLAFGVATLALIPAARNPVPRADWPRIALIGVTWMAAPFLLFSIALRTVDSSLGGMINGAAPIFAAVVAAIFAQRLPGWRQQLGLVIGLAGVVVVSLPSVIGARATTMGVALLLAATLCYGVAINIASPLQQRLGSLPVVWRAEMVALVALTPFALSGIGKSSFAWSSLAAVVVLGSLGTAIAFVAFTTLIGRVGATRGSVAIYFLPPVAIALGALVRDEPVGPSAIVGTVLIILGAWFASRRETVVVRPAALSRAAVLVAFVALAPRAGAQEAPRDNNEVWPLPRLTGSIRLDGRSDDAAWRAVPVLPMTVYLPRHGATPTERTEVRIAYDNDALYIAVDAWEAHPGSIRASTMIRDDDGPGDFVNVLLDPFGDRQNAVNFSTTPGGNRNDWAVSNDAASVASFTPHWNGVWELASTRDEDGWHAEYRIPFSTLRFDARDGRVEFGLSVNRLTAHANERVTFPAIAPTAATALWKPSRFQRVSVDGINTARSIRFIPYTAAGIEGTRAPDPILSPWSSKERFEAGGDLKVAVTPYLNLDLTANTDFAEAEADDQRVNLTRFPLLYPERRPFFLERAGTFTFRTGETDLLFNSRRIGLTATGEPVRLIAGARLVGRVAGWDVGLLDAETGHSAGQRAENLGVVRLSRRVLNSRSWLGVMSAHRIATDSNQLALGMDGELNLAGDDYLSFGVAQLIGEVGAGPSGGVLPRGALRVLAERRRNRSVWYRAGIGTTGALYQPSLGYVERSDAVRPLAELGYGRQVSSAGHVFRTSLGTALAWRNAAGSFEGSSSTAAFSLEMPTGATYTLSANRQEDELLAPFMPTRETTVPTGRFVADYVSVSFTPSSGPRAVVGWMARGGEYYDGTQYSLILAPEWRASAHLRLVAELQGDRLEFSSRNEREWTRLARLRILASANAQLSMAALVQTNSQARLATANVRVRYNLREGDDLWIVYGHHANLERDRIAPEGPVTARSGVLVKLTRSFGT